MGQTADSTSGHAQDLAPCASIMMVDDTPENLHLLIEVLSRHGYQVRPFCSGEQALESIMTELPDLLLLDINMPGMDGFEVAARIQSLSLPRPLPIIFLSAHQDIEAKSKAFASGAVDYLGKPFQQEELLARVAAHLKILRLQRDLQEQNQQLGAANATLQALSEAKSRFLSTMSHEIRTPMTGVLGMVELLQRTVLDVSQRHYVKTIHSCGETLLTVLNDILDYSKIQAGKLSLESIEVNLVDLIDDCAAIFAGKSVASGVVLLAEVAPGTPSMVIGDPTRLTQMLTNLLSNAFKFTPQGEVYLKVSQRGERLRFEVKDTGLGIDMQRQDCLFDAFNQAEESTARRFGGTGLGLAICRELCHLMEGLIGVDSQPGEGSCFWFEVPLRPQPAVDNTALDSVYLLEAKRLLIIDPQQSLCHLWQRQGLSWGMDVDYQTEVQDSFDAQPYDLVMLAVSQFVSVEEGLAFSHRYCLGRCLLVTEGHQGIAPERLQQAGVVSVLERPFGIHYWQQQLIHALGGEPLAASHPLLVDELSQLGQMTLLVAEDNTVNQMVIKSMLGKFGIEPQMVSNGREAVSFYREALACGCLPDLILMDCEMPEVDGFEAAQQIRQLEQDKKIRTTVPIIALSAHVLDEQRQRAISSGMNGYMTKPINLKRLDETLRLYSGEASLH